MGATPLTKSSPWSRRSYDEVPDTVSQEVADFVADLVQRGLAGYEVESN